MTRSSQDALAAKFPDAIEPPGPAAAAWSGFDRRLHLLRQDIANDPSMLGKTVDYSFPVDDFADLYLKGLLADHGNVDAHCHGDVDGFGDSGDVELTFANDAILAHCPRAPAQPRARAACCN